MLPAEEQPAEIEDGCWPEKRGRKTVEGQVETRLTRCARSLVGALRPCADHVRSTRLSDADLTSSGDCPRGRLGDPEIGTSRSIEERPIKKLHVCS